MPFLLGTAVVNRPIHSHVLTPGDASGLDRLNSRWRHTWSQAQQALRMAPVSTTMGLILLLLGVGLGATAHLCVRYERHQEAERLRAHLVKRQADVLGLRAQLITRLQATALRNQVTAFTANTQSDGTLQWQALLTTLPPDGYWLSAHWRPGEIAWSGVVRDPDGPTRAMQRWASAMPHWQEAQSDLPAVLNPALGSEAEAFVFNASAHWRWHDVP